MSASRELRGLCRCRTCGRSAHESWIPAGGFSRGHSRIGHSGTTLSAYVPSLPVRVCVVGPLFGAVRAFCRAASRDHVGFVLTLTCCDSSSLDFDMCCGRWGHTSDVCRCRVFVRSDSERWRRQIDLLFDLDGNGGARERHPWRRGSCVCFWSVHFTQHSASRAAPAFVARHGCTGKAPVDSIDSVEQSRCHPLTNPLCNAVVHRECLHSHCLRPRRLCIVPQVVHLVGRCSVQVYSGLPVANVAVICPPLHRTVVVPLHFV